MTTRYKNVLTKATPIGSRSSFAGCLSIVSLKILTNGFLGSRFLSLHKKYHRNYRKADNHKLITITKHRMKNQNKKNKRHDKENSNHRNLLLISKEQLRKLSTDNQSTTSP